jgi:type I restriction enzyme S subunit
MRDNWKEIKLDDIGNIVTGSTPSTKIPSYWDGLYPFYSPADFKGKVNCSETERTLTEEGLKTGRILPVNSVLFTCIGSIGKMAINTEVGISNQQINSVLVNVLNDFKFVYYLLFHFKYRFKNFAPMTTIQIINKTEFGKFKFNLPPLPQQEKIAKILSTVDDVIEKTGSAIAKYQAIKQGLMHDLFTRGIDVNTGKLRPIPQDAPELYKKSTLGLIPKDWEVKKLEEFAVINYGKDYKANPKGDDFPIYGTGGIMGWTSKVLNSGPAVLTGRKGTINRPIYVEGDFWNVDTIFCINSNEFTNIKWFFFQMVSKDLTKLNEATGVPSVNSNALNNLEFSYPKKIEQDQITKRINLIDDKIQTEQQTLAKYQQLKAGLLQDLLTGRVVVGE